MVKVFTKSGCAKCEHLKRILKSNNVDFVEKSLDNDDVIVELIMLNSDIAEAPVMVLDDNTIIVNRDGFLKTLKERGLIK